MECGKERLLLTRFQNLFRNGLAHRLLYCAAWYYGCNPQSSRLLTVGAAHPLQVAGAYAMSLPRNYYDALQTEYAPKKDILFPALREAGFKCFAPEGAYYIMTDISGFGFANDIEFTRHLIQNIGVAVVPASSFITIKYGLTAGSLLFLQKRRNFIRGGRTPAKAEKRLKSIYQKAFLQLF